MGQVFVTYLLKLIVGCFAISIVLTALGKGLELSEAIMAPLCILAGAAWGYLAAQDLIKALGGYDD